MQISPSSPGATALPSGSQISTSARSCGRPTVVQRFSGGSSGLGTASWPTSIAP
jgi:hypothetical protein